MSENSTSKILLVDDDQDIQEFLSYNFRKENYNVISAYNGFDAIEIAKKTKPGLIILDIMMPGIDGIETCAKIRKISGLENTIIIMLSARSEDFTQIAGYDAGADDYITKPIKPAILIKKIKSLLRRLNNNNLSSSSLLVNYEKYTVIENNNEIALSKKEFKILGLLYSNPEKVFSREEIFKKIWGVDNVIVGDRTIDVHIRKIRKKIGGKYIKTYKGIGYKFANK